MLGSAETSCLEMLLAFVKDNPRFRPITLEDEGALLHDLDYKRSFLLMKGSYKARDMVLGMMLNYDITRSGAAGSGVSIMYRFLCSPPILARFSPETEDKVTKIVGPDPEVEIGDKPIDDAFLIHTGEPDVLAKLLDQGVLRDSLLTHVQGMDKFEMGPRWIELERTFIEEKVNVETLQSDLDELSDIAAGFTTEGE